MGRIPISTPSLALLTFICNQEGNGMLVYVFSRILLSSVSIHYIELLNTVVPTISDVHQVPDK